jgi:hypothetical protein
VLLADDTKYMYLQRHEHPRKVLRYIWRAIRLCLLVSPHFNAALTAMLLRSVRKFGVDLPLVTPAAHFLILLYLQSNTWWCNAHKCVAFEMNQSPTNKQQHSS